MHGASKDKPHYKCTLLRNDSGKVDMNIHCCMDLLFSLQSLSRGQDRLQCTLCYSNMAVQMMPNYQKAPMRIYYIAGPKKESINLYSNPTEVSLDSFLGIFLHINLKPTLAVKVQF